MIAFITRAGLLAAVAITTAAPAAAQAGDRELGQFLASECVTCHQLSGRYSGIPSIIGWPQDAFVAVLTDYRERRRDNLAMRNVAAALTDEDIAALAAYFGSLQPKTD